MLAQLAVANVLAFGNGTVMAAVLQNAFVQQAHALSNEQLLYAFALARVTPGQATPVRCFVFLLVFWARGGASGGLFCFFCVFFFSCCFGGFLLFAAPGAVRVFFWLAGGPWGFCF